MFPQLDHQKRVIAKSMKMQQWPMKSKLKSTKSNHRSDDSDSGERSKSPNRNKKYKFNHFPRPKRDRQDTS